MFLFFCFSLGRILTIKSRFSTMLFEISASIAYSNENNSLVARNGNEAEVNITSENAANIYKMIANAGPVAWGSKADKGAQNIMFFFGNETSLKLYVNNKGNMVIRFEGDKHTYTFILGTYARFANAQLFTSNDRNK